MQDITQTKHGDSVIDEKQQELSTLVRSLPSVAKKQRIAEDNRSVVISASGNMAIVKQRQIDGINASGLNVCYETYPASPKEYLTLAELWATKDLC